MTKAKTPAPEADAKTEDPGLPLTAPGAPDQPGADTPTAEQLASAAAEAEATAAKEAAEADAAAAAAAEADAKAKAEAAEAEAAEKAAIEAQALADAAAAAEADATAKADAEAEASDQAANDAAIRAAEARDLTTVATTIAMLNVTGHRLGLISDLQDQWGAIIPGSDGEGVTVDMCGIKTNPADSVENALTNWANAARRKAAELVG